MEGESIGSDKWNGGGYLVDELETQCNVNSQESIRITLSKFPSNGR